MYRFLYNEPHLLCCSSDCVTLSEPAKAKAGTPSKAKGPVAVKNAQLPGNERE